MSSQIDARAIAKQIAEEHAELRKCVASAKAALASAPADATAIRAAFLDLDSHLKQHFAYEEEGGYFTEAVSIAPRLSDTVARLKDQHVALAKLLSEITSQWEAGGEGRGQTAARFDEFQRQLWKHEAEEDDTIQTAFTEDIGDHD